MNNILIGSVISILVVLIVYLIVRYNKDNFTNTNINITKHIVFYYKEDEDEGAFQYNKERFQYLSRIVDNVNTYDWPTDIFIHTNRNFNIAILPENNKGELHAVVHDLRGIDPFKLTWMPRKMMKEQKDSYDIFIYLEDDTLIPPEAIKYWLEYKDKLPSDYNLGFFRICKNENGDEFIGDIANKKLRNKLKINDEEYIINDVNPYVAFWIYDNRIFNRFVNSEFWDINNIYGYDTRAKSAIGLHGIEGPPNRHYYKHTVVPLVAGKLHASSRVYHMSNNGIDSGYWASIRFNDAIEI